MKYTSTILFYEKAFKCICIFYHLSTLTWHFGILLCWRQGPAYHGSWWPGDGRSQGIISHGNDISLPGILWPQHQHINWHCPPYIQTEIYHKFSAKLQSSALAMELLQSCTKPSIWQQWMCSISPLWLLWHTEVWPNYQESRSRLKLGWGSLLVMTGPSSYHSNRKSRKKVIKPGQEKQERLFNLSLSGLNISITNFYILFVCLFHINW